MITLTNGKLVQVNGVTTENDTQGVNVSYHVDFLANTVLFTFNIGSGAPSAFNISAFFSSPTTLTVDLTTGNWVSSNGLSGTIGATPLANFVAQTKAIRNTVESFASSAIMPGTQTPWT